MTALKRERRFTRCDAAALILGAALIVYFLCTIRLSVGMPDEGTYYMIAHRIGMGARMISDDWNLTQFGFLVNYPLCRLYMAVTGGTEGIVLFMRYAFLAADLLFYVYTYVKLRRFGFAGVAASFFFCAMFPQLFLAFSYCTVSLFGMMWICLVLFVDEKKKSAPRLVAVGVVFAVVVLEDPFMVFLFLFWLAAAACLAVVKRRGGGAAFSVSWLLAPRACFCITAGCVLVFIAFLSFLLWNHAFDELGTVLPFLFSGAEYNPRSVASYDMISSAARYFGVWPVVGLALCIPSAAALRLARKAPRSARVALGAAACGFLAAGLIYGAAASLSKRGYNTAALFSQYHNLPLLLFAPTVFLLDPAPDGRRVSFLIAGVVYGVLMDIPSKSFLAIGGFLVRVPLLLELPDLLRALRKAQPEAAAPPAEKKRLYASARAAAAAAAAAALSVCLVWDLAYVGAEGALKVPERLFMYSSLPMDQTLERGIYKGLKTTKEVARVCEDTFADLDRIREDPDCAVAVLEMAAFVYMYLDRPYATFSPVYSGEIERLYDYWKLPFTREPDIVYVPYYNYFLFFRYDKSVLDWLKNNVMQYVEGTVEYGKAGFIIHVSSVP